MAPLPSITSAIANDARALLGERMRFFERSSDYHRRRPPGWQTWRFPQTYTYTGSGGSWVDLGASADTGPITVDTDPTLLMVYAHAEMVDYGCIRLVPYSTTHGALWAPFAEYWEIGPLGNTAPGAWDWFGLGSKCFSSPSLMSAVLPASGGMHLLPIFTDYDAALSIPMTINFKVQRFLANSGDTGSARNIQISVARL